MASNKLWYTHFPEPLLGRGLGCWGTMYTQIHTLDDLGASPKHVPQRIQASFWPRAPARGGPPENSGCREHDPSIPTKGHGARGGSAGLVPKKTPWGLIFYTFWSILEAKPGRKRVGKRVAPTEMRAPAGNLSHGWYPQLCTKKMYSQFPPADILEHPAGGKLRFGGVLAISFSRVSPWAGVRAERREAVSTHRACAPPPHPLQCKCNSPCGKQVTVVYK
eukprot:gene25619-biopygen16510